MTGHVRDLILEARIGGWWPHLDLRVRDLDLATRIGHDVIIYPALLTQECFCKFPAIPGPSVRDRLVGLVTFRRLLVILVINEDLSR